MNWKKTIYLLLLIFGLINPKISMAVEVDTSICEQKIGTGGMNNAISACNATLTGAKGCCSVGPNSKCPYCTDVCSSSACSDKPDWTKWTVICKAVCNKNGGYYTTYSWSYTYELKSGVTGIPLCSTGDKYRPDANTTALYAGQCNCTTGGAYKYCCDVNGYPEQARSGGKLFTTDEYPEGYCPGGNGYLIDGDRIRSSPCTPNCVADCNGDSRFLQTCDHNTFVGNCGQTCYGSMGTDCRNSGDYCVGTQGKSINGCDMCNGTKPAVGGTSGSCGSSNGGTFTTTPTALCNSGTASAVTTGATTYGWTCAGTEGTCGGANGSTANCSATRNVPPTFSSITVKNNNGTIVAAESGNVNQICQNEFNGIRTVNLTVNADDPNGVGTISDIQLRWNGINFTRTGLANGVANFSHTFAVGENTTGAVDFQVYISDGTNTTGWITTGRSLKVWDCNVSVSGRLYDGGASGNCSVAADYLTPAINTNFKTLDFTDSPTMNMSRSSENQYSGNLTWGKSYTSMLNSDLAMQISGSGVKTTDVSAGTSYCPNSIAFSLNNNILNPYSSSPTLRVDFSGVVDQDSWYQAVGGGLLANRIITNRVPVTCTTNCAMSINGTTNTNGMVSGPTINNTGNSDANKGSPNNWWINKALAETNSEYGELLNQFFYKAGVGITFNGNKKLSEVGNNGVNFVKGDLLVTEDNNVSSGQFLMVIVDGNIIVQSNVKNLEGVFVSKNLNIGGSDTNALTIEGMVKATENVKINRTFINKRTNNTAAAVKFIYRPDFIFSMPGAITKQLTKWQWGN